MCPMKSNAMGSLGIQGDLIHAKVYNESNRIEIWFEPVESIKVQQNFMDPKRIAYIFDIHLLILIML